MKSLLCLIDFENKIIFSFVVQQINTRDKKLIIKIHDEHNILIDFFHKIYIVLNLSKYFVFKLLNFF